jgi:hypothetical protein
MKGRYILADFRHPQLYLYEKYYLSINYYIKYEEQTFTAKIDYLNSQSLLYQSLLSRHCQFIF